MRTEELDFELPPERIATRPVSPRDAARLMVVRASEPDAAPEHRFVRDLPQILAPKDVLVLNRSRVVPARFVGFTEQTRGGAEGLWLGEEPEHGEGLRWRVLLKARRFRPGRRVRLLGPDDAPSPVALELIEKCDDPGEAGAWRVLVRDDAGPRATPEVLDAVGRTPLPRYILQARKSAGEDVADALDRSDYQTTFAGGGGAEDAPASASVAAPTAGLHFTPELFGRLEAAGIERAEVTLHVGAGTFKPIEAETVDAHSMHAEWCSLEPAGPARTIDRGEGRVVAVGSTSTRTLEAFAAIRRRGEPLPPWLETDLLIAPGYTWQRVDAIMTNFHLPRSTLLALVAASVSGGIERVRELYRVAMQREYRFFSYGDAMLILP